MNELYYKLQYHTMLTTKKYSIIFELNLVFTSHDSFHFHFNYTPRTVYQMSLDKSLR